MVTATASSPKAAITPERWGEERSERQLYCGLTKRSGRTARGRIGSASESHYSLASYQIDLSNSPQLSSMSEIMKLTLYSPRKL